MPNGTIPKTTPAVGHKTALRILEFAKRGAVVREYRVDSGIRNARMRALKGRIGKGTHGDTRDIGKTGQPNSPNSQTGQGTQGATGDEVFRHPFCSSLSLLPLNRDYRGQIQWTGPGWG